MKTSMRSNFLHLLVLTMLVNVLAQVVHETGHLSVYQLMGHQPVWAFTRLVQLGEPPINPDGWVEISNPDGSSNWLKVRSIPAGTIEKAVLAAAGPVTGLLSAVLGLVIWRRSSRSASGQVWLAYALTISLVAVLYYLRSPLRTGGDEYDIAMQLGLARYIVELPLGLGYLTCLVLGLHELKTWRDRFTWLGAVLLGSIATGVLMTILDTVIIAQVNAGNPWFRAVTGYSLPVFSTIALVLVGLAGWIRWPDQNKVFPS